MPPLEPAAYFKPGTPVVLQGLASQSDFNGLRGVVSAFDADCGRYNVMIDWAKCVEAFGQGEVQEPRPCSAITVSTAALLPTGTATLLPAGPTICGHGPSR